VNRAANGQRTRIVAYAAIGLLTAALIFATVLPASQPAERPFDFDSAAPSGLAGLRLWLQELGFAVKDIRGQRFIVPPDADLILVFPGQTRFEKTETEALRSWVEKGGTLALVAVDDPNLGEAFGGAEGEFSLDDDLTQPQPLLPDLPGEMADLGGGRTLDLADAEEYALALQFDDDATLAVRKMGRGQVWRLSGYHLLTNGNLREENHAAAVIALLRATPQGGAVYFDAYHLFGPEVAASIETLQDWLYRTPLGWATVFGLLTLAVFWVMQGRRLGPALPTIHEVRRREAAEYVQAMANLQRRANVRPMVATHHKRRIKLSLGRPLHLSADLSDGEFVNRLAEAYPHMAADQLSRLRHILATLDRPADEHALIKAAAAGDDLLKAWGE
jgi:hypothetical protein